MVSLSPCQKKVELSDSALSKEVAASGTENRSKIVEAEHDAIEAESTESSGEEDEEQEGGEDSEIASNGNSGDEELAGTKSRVTDKVASSGIETENSGSGSEEDAEAALNGTRGHQTAKAWISKAATAPRVPGTDFDDGNQESLEQDEKIQNESSGTRSDAPTSSPMDPVQLQIATAPQPEKTSPPKRPKPTSGVVYVSRIPPGMDVGALRALLSRSGRIGRVWLRPESPEARKERRALGSSRGRGEFMDGWVEFPKRRDAKRAIALLNGRPMAGAKRRGRWADDLWCMKLLRGYTWNDLIEETCAGARERTLRVKAEIAAARREKAFVEERFSMARRIEKDDAEKKPVRYFRQKRAIQDREWEEDVDERRARDAMKRVDEELETGKAKPIDQELMGMLFKKRRTG